MSFPKHIVDGNRMGTVPQATGVAAGCVNDLMVCPYNESHVVSGGRYVAHLMKCRKMAEAAKGAAGGGELPKDDNDIKVCPFNRSHQVHFSVLDKHIQLCDSFYTYCMETQDLPASMVREEQGLSRKRSKKSSSRGTSDDESSSDDDEEEDIDSKTRSLKIK